MSNTKSKRPGLIIAGFIYARFATTTWLTSNAIGFAEYGAMTVIVIECDKCFEHFFFHAGPLEYEFFISYVTMGKNKHFPIGS
jgi:hypothetical protein